MALVLSSARAVLKSVSQVFWSGNVPWVINATSILPRAAKRGGEYLFMRIKIIHVESAVTDRSTSPNP